MDFRIEFTRSAVGDLESIAEFISSDNEEAAKRVCRSPYDLALSLARNPELGRATPEFGNTNIRDIAKGQYRIVYRLLTDQKLVQIIRFWHGARGYFPDLPDS